MTKSKFFFKPSAGYKACVVRHLKNQCSQLRAALSRDPDLKEFDRILRQLSAVQNRAGKAQFSLRSNLADVPKQEWFDRYDELFDSCLGSLEVFRPAAGKLPEFERLSKLTAKLGSILSFAHNLEYAL